MTNDLRREALMDAQYFEHSMNYGNPADGNDVNDLVMLIRRLIDKPRLLDKSYYLTDDEGKFSYHEDCEQCLEPDDD